MPKNLNLGCRQRWRSFSKDISFFATRKTTCVTTWPECWLISRMKSRYQSFILFWFFGGEKNEWCKKFFLQPFCITNSAFLELFLFLLLEVVLLFTTCFVFSDGWGMEPTSVCWPNFEQKIIEFVMALLEQFLHYLIKLNMCNLL